MAVLFVHILGSTLEGPAPLPFKQSKHGPLFFCVVEGAKTVNGSMYYS